MQLRNQFGDYAGGLEHALALATLAHADHRELAGASHSLYPARAALTLPDSDPDARTIALLHDVIEETDLTALRDYESKGQSRPRVMASIDAVLARRASAKS